MIAIWYLVCDRDGLSVIEVIIHILLYFIPAFFLLILSLIMSKCYCLMMN